jgi:hypothetical protein
MLRNVGGVDRMLRIFFGAMLVAVAIFSTHEYAVWGWLGLIPLLTGVVRICPAYLPFGINTCKRSKA